MANHVYKLVGIVGTSTTGSDDAIRNAIGCDTRFTRMPVVPPPRQSPDPQPSPTARPRE